ESAVAFLEAAVAYYAGLGVTVTRVMTDNGSCYRSRAFKAACKALGLRHIRTRPYTPKTNGKAERFIQTALREWAYAQAYPTSQRRAEELPIWLHRYNWHRPHGSLKSKSPISRLALSEDNLLRLHSEPRSLVHLRGEMTGDRNVILHAIRLGLETALHRVHHTDTNAGC